MEFIVILVNEGMPAASGRGAPAMNDIRRERGQAARAPMWRSVVACLRSRGLRTPAGPPPQVLGNLQGGTYPEKTAAPFGRAGRYFARATSPAAGRRANRVARRRPISTATKAAPAREKCLPSARRVLVATPLMVATSWY
jgi:hypothetical protein